MGDVLPVVEDHPAYAVLPQPPLDTLLDMARQLVSDQSDDALQLYVHSTCMARLSDIVRLVLVRLEETNRPFLEVDLLKLVVGIGEITVKTTAERHGVSKQYVSKRLHELEVSLNIKSPRTASQSFRTACREASQQRTEKNTTTKKNGGARESR